MEKRLLSVLGIFILIASMPQTLGHDESLGRTAEANFMDIVPEQKCSPSTPDNPFVQHKLESKIWSQSEAKLIPLSSDTPSTIVPVFEERVKDLRDFVREDRLNSLVEPVRNASADIKARKFPNFKDAIDTYNDYSDSVRLWKEEIQEIEDRKVSLRDLNFLRDNYLKSPQDKGIGFEVKKVAAGLVEIWVLWPDKSGTPKRMHAAPVLTVEEKSIDPKFFTSLEEGKFNQTNSFNGGELGVDGQGGVAVVLEHF